MKAGSEFATEGTEMNLIESSLESTDDRIRVCETEDFLVLSVLGELCG